ncbi:MAG TPA: ABC transporter permease [Acidimicrobiales bacterium]|jgi:ABC-2 type transport system permease protein|nr:ABC transporter permease [Acidimicrobiales bacterium]
MTTATLTVPIIAAPARAARVRALPTLAARRLALSVRSPRAIAVPLMAPVLFALVVAPALADGVSSPAQRPLYMTFFCVATCGLLIPLNCMFFGLGVLVDKQHGAMRELLVAPIRRASIVFGNLAAAAIVTALQLVVLLLASVFRGAHYVVSDRLFWFVAGAFLLIAVTYGIAEVLVTRLTSPEEYSGVIPVVAIVPFFFAGSLYPITSLPTWLADIAKMLPLTHALALFRYGLTAHGAQALHNIWGMSNATEMAALSLGVLALYATLTTAGAVRLFTKSGTS